MKHLVNSANVGIGFRTRVPFFAENHCKVNQLFDIYSIFDSQYIICFQEKAFHSSVHCGDRFLERTEILNLDSIHIVVI